MTCLGTIGFDRVRDALRSVTEPSLGRDLVAAGQVCAIETGPARVNVRLVRPSASVFLDDMVVANAALAIRHALGPVPEINVTILRY